MHFPSPWAASRSALDSTARPSSSLLMLPKLKLASSVRGITRSPNRTNLRRICKGLPSI